MKHSLNIGAAAIVAACAAGPVWSADAANLKWAAIPRSEITLFYPGQASYQFVTSDRHPGSKPLAGGMSCVQCHKGKEAEFGDKIAAGKAHEPSPVKGKAGAVKVTMQAAFDDENVYMRISWPAKVAGAYHEYAVYQDGKWETYATNRSNPGVAAGKLKASYEDRFTIMLGDGKSVPAFNNYGCWITCHNDMRYMPNEPKKDAVQAHPILGSAGMKKDDIRKYIPETRTAMGPTGGWDKIKTKGEIDALKSRGVLLELWQWRGYRSNPARAADDGYVLEYRNFDAGGNPFFNNWDGGKNQPRFMYDPEKNNGRAGLTAARFRDPDAPILSAANRAPYDPKAGWKTGDILPKYGSDAPKGSAGDNAPVVGTWAKGVWTVLWTRKLDTGNPDDIALKPGATYPVGLAVHDDHATARFHQVSFPLKLTLGGKDGDVNAVRTQ